MQRYTTHSMTTAHSTHSPSRRRVSSALAGAVAVLTVALAPLRASDDPTTRYFNGLRQLSLFSVAEGYCQERLADEQLSPAGRARLTLELSRTLTEHAKFSAGDEQEQLWDRAASVVGEFLDRHRDVPSRWELELQLALVPAAKGEFLRWQSELMVGDIATGRQARSAFEQSIAELEKRHTDIYDGFRIGLRNPDASPIPPHEIRSLLQTTNFEQARCWLGLAHLSHRETPERAASIARSEELLKKLSEETISDEMQQRVAVHLAECRRLAGDYARANRLLRQIEAGGPPQAVLDRTMAERTLMLLDLDRPADAAEQLLAYRRQRGQLEGELRYLSVRALSALANFAETKGDPQLATEVRKEIETQVASAQAEVGGYWGARCQALLELSHRQREYGGELAEIVLRAESLYSQARNTEAVKEYAQAAAAAYRLGKPELAARFAYTRASILLHDEHYQSAADGLREIAKRMPESSLAASAHLLHAYCLGKLYDQRRTARRREAYTAALESHRQNFSKSRHEATWMLAQLQEGRLQTNQALKLYLEIPAEHKRGGAAQAAVARCYETIIERLRTQPQPGSAAWEDRSLQQLSQIAASFPNETGQLDPLQAEVIVRLARLYLSRPSPEYAAADRLLERIFRSSHSGMSPGDGGLPLGEARWEKLIHQATQLRIVSLASQGRFAQATLLVNQLSQSDAHDVLEILSGLMQLSPRTHNSTRRALGELQLRAAQQLRGRQAELDEQGRQLLDRCLAEAYTATGMTDRAAQTYESLVQRLPRDKQLRRALGQLLFECGSAECLTKAKAHWRELEALETPGDEDWFAARYEVAHCCLKLGQFGQARKLLASTRLLYPTLGGTKQKGRFEALHQQLNRVSAQ